MEIVEHPNALIDVATQSTVSRTVLTSEGIRVVLFSFDAGEELSEVALRTKVPHRVLALAPSKMALFMLDARAK